MFFFVLSICSSPFLLSSRILRNTREFVEGHPGTECTIWPASFSPLTLALVFDSGTRLVHVRVVVRFLSFYSGLPPTLVTHFIGRTHLMPGVSLREPQWNIKDFNSVAQQDANVPDVNLSIEQIELHSPANTTEKCKPVNYADFAGYTTYYPDASATHAHTVAMPSVSQFGSHAQTTGAKGMPGSRCGSRNHRGLPTMDVQGDYMHNARVLQRCIDHASGAQRIRLVAETTLGASTLARGYGNHGSRSLTDIHATSALAPSPLHHRAVFNEGETSVPVAPASAPVGPVYYEPSEAVPQPGMQTSRFFQYPTSTSYPTQALSTARQGYLHTSPTTATRLLHSPVWRDSPSAEEQLAHATFVRRLRVVTSHLAYAGL
ncbi:hypothetical protein FRC12_006470 [Ceratobasidium sp. 428]|nr:hypothetical protein FRC12_006470 [Ceratobasidium sp. 428]